MRNEFFNKKSEIIIKQRNVLLILFISSILIIFLQVIVLIKKDTKIILVPNNLSQETVLYSNKISNEYLEAFTRDIIYSFLNITPNNIEYNEKIILSLIHPRFYGTIKTQLQNIKTNVKTQKFTTAFYPVFMILNNKKLNVIVDGTLITFLGQKEISKVKKRYSIDYQ
jgi:conjugal transfer pilus assembly protein TraE